MGQNPRQDELDIYARRHTRLVLVDLHISYFLGSDLVVTSDILLQVFANNSVQSPSWSRARFHTQSNSLGQAEKLFYVSGPSISSSTCFDFLSMNETNSRNKSVSAPFMHKRTSASIRLQVLGTKRSWLEGVYSKDSADHVGFRTSNSMNSVGILSASGSVFDQSLDHNDSKPARM